MATLLVLKEELGRRHRQLERFRTQLKHALPTHIQDEFSILIASALPFEHPRLLWKDREFGRLLKADFVNTAFCFTLSGVECHSNGLVQSVLPAFVRGEQQRIARRATSPVTAALVPGGATDRSKLDAAIAKLRAGGDLRKRKAS